MPPLLCTLRHALVLETLFAALIHSKSFVVPRIIIINVAKCNLGKVKLQANAVSGLLLKRTWSLGWPQGPFAYLVTYVASHAGIFELIFADLLLSESLRILAPSLSLPFCALVSIRSGEYFPLNSFSVMVSVGGCMQGWFPLAGLPWIPPCYAWGVQAPVQPLRHQFPSSSIGNEFNLDKKQGFHKGQQKEEYNW